jgi:hypothetical protein
VHNAGGDRHGTGGCFGILLTGALLAGLIAMLFELEILEGIIVAVISWAIYVGVFVFLAQVL